MSDFPNIGKVGRAARPWVAAAAMLVAAGRLNGQTATAEEMPFPTVDWSVWRRGPEFMAPVREKDPAEWTEEERAIHRQLEQEVRRDHPSDRLVFDDGSEWEGYIWQRTADAVVFEKRYGQSGSMKVSVPMARVRMLQKTDAPPRVTYRDVQFRMEFPDLLFRKAPPYTLVSDASYFEVEDAVNELRRLYHEIVRVFDPLMASTSRREDIQVLIFSSRTKFEAYREKYVGDHTSISGFYNPWLDRLVWFHQRESEAVERARAWLAAEEKKYRGLHPDRPEVQFQIDEWKREMENRIEAFAREMTTRTLRHEGAHQIYFSLGLHSPHFVENDWVYEGLAAYAEVLPFGARNPERIAVLKEALEANGLIPLHRLVGAKDPRGFAVFGDAARTELAYCEAWALVAFLMEPPRRSSFMKYLSFLRTPENVEEVARTNPVMLLARFVNRPPDELESDWIRWMRSL